MFCFTDVDLSEYLVVEPKSGDETRANWLKSATPTIVRLLFTTVRSTVNDCMIVCPVGCVSVYTYARRSNQLLPGH